ncbi:vacuolar protein sorting-associated protein 41 homolog isoform X1 [Phragmites australis]|uniref:vacuolar protein sorting-associated protein 41 homolog isoform X1 n=1 Tax=Phragmites australis TaxID=29695 RepID=UPI002D76AF7B|nr:vacuolar protein sorting-associated protein 41 homolog isoform X1 [Phragmites australis]
MMSTAQRGHPPHENGAGGDGDDEREEEEDGDEGDEGEEEEDEVEVEEEPRLKYQRLGGSAPAILSTDAAAAIAVADRMVALGTHNGTLHILDFQGNQVKEISVHTATINDISFDADGEYIGSCSDDGTVAISSLFTDEKLKFEYHRPMKAIALDPNYSRNYRRFSTGGLAGQVLVLTKKTWGGGYNKKVLRDGEGPIHSMKWRADLLAWANNAGVKVHDMKTDKGIAFIERPKGIPRPEFLVPHLVWQDDTVLVIGWGTSVKIAAIRTDLSQGLNGIQRTITNEKYVDIVGSFQTGYHISGIAPFGDLLVVLAYIPDEDDRDKKFSTSVPSRQGTAQRPEIHLVSWKNDELTTDALPIHGYEHYKAKDYVLAHVPFSGSSNAGGQWAAGDEPLYYIVSPKDVVVAKPRDAEDHIAWLLQHGWHEKALAAVEAGQGRTELLDEVGSRYLDHLIIERKYSEAAQLCPKLLRGSPSAWERWVFHFAHLRQLPVLVPYIPTENPQLSDTAYEVALVALTANPSFHELLLATVKNWPPTLYSASPVISAIEPQLNSSSMTDPLKEALAELYVINSQYEKAFSLYAELLKPEVFVFIEKYNLHDAIHDKVVNLMILDSKKTLYLLIQHRDIIPPYEVVEQLLHTSKNCDKKYLLHLYLHALFETDIHAGKDFHDMQVELYVEYEPRMLLPFLRTSQHYRLDKAYEIFAQKERVKEQVFVLGRMGNAKEALSTIINKLEDIQEAVEFVMEQHDDELWEELIRQCLQKPEMVGMLLEHTVGNLDPLYIVSLVPDGLEIPRLRDRLVKIVTDYRTETSLRNGCNDILKVNSLWFTTLLFHPSENLSVCHTCLLQADCVNLLVKYYHEARRGVYMASMDEEVHGNRVDDGSLRASERSSVRALDIKSRTRCGARCCLCFDPLPIQDISAIVFYCCHAYHLSCLEGGLDLMRSNSNQDSDNGSDDADGSPSGESRMRCVLCTTAAA